MASITYIQANGQERVIDVPDGDSLMHGATHNGVRGILAECGGDCACATCHLYLEDGPLDQVPAATSLEDEMLDGVAAQRLAGSRLSCQIAVGPALDGLVVRIPDRQF